MRGRGKDYTWAQMLTFWCSGACMLLLGGMVAYCNLHQPKKCYYS